jgi:hypothetical protein
MHIVLLARRSHAPPGTSGTGTGKPVKTGPGLPVIYRDSLVSITGDSITFFRYSFPLLSDREVLFQDIDFIEIKKPTILAGKWRLWGSGNFSTWFPLDGNRPSRDRIFHATLKTGGMNIGFTVEHSDQVILILKKKGLITSDEVTG